MNLHIGFKSVVYHGESCLGELDIVSPKDPNFKFRNNEIIIDHLSNVSERCLPLSILQTISSSVLCKLESLSLHEQPHLINLHASCFYELKTAVILFGDEEIHLVAMPSKRKKFPCFWCFSVQRHLYDSCIGMLNLRCLAIVFDLDETLIVANTMKSFEDRIEGLKGWISHETDPIRMLGMTAEMKRCADDRALLKQYTEGDFVMDNGKMFKVQPEEVPRISNNHERVVRPIIRLQEKNIVFTRINPENRDTSVLVRLRPAWEDLRSYLTAMGRKRFEVYVCTMAERDYALEMWRLLDPESHLIGSKQLSDRVVCVKSGSKKSLINVFQDGICHPKIAMVIDDRQKVWEDQDQPRVHAVPPFTPYYAPQAETANAVPVLCVARNVACNVRGGFFKEFDENFLRKIFELFYEDEMMDLPHSPDVSNYLMSEDTGFMPNGRMNAPIVEGMNGAEVERRLNQPIEKNAVDSSTLSIANGSEKKPEISRRLLNIIGVAPSRIVLPTQTPSLPGVSVGRNVNSSVLDPDSKRSLIMKHSQDVSGQSLVEPPLLSRQQEFGALRNDKQRNHHNSRGHFVTFSTPSSLLSHVSQVKVGEASSVNEKQNISLASHPFEFGSSHNQASSNSKEPQREDGKVNLLPSSLSIGVLQEIGRRCGSKVEFRWILSTNKDLQFYVEVLFTGEKIGFGMGKTKKDAQQQASEVALHSLADKYLAYIRPCPETSDKEKLLVENENGFVWESGTNELDAENGLPKESTSEVADMAVGGTSSNMTNHQVYKHNRDDSLRMP